MEICIGNEFVFKITKKDKPRPILVPMGTPHFHVKYGTILSFKEQWATLLYIFDLLDKLRFHRAKCSAAANYGSISTNGACGLKGRQMDSRCKVQISSLMHYNGGFPLVEST